ncbi:MAG: hypothetical protein II453_13995 [Alphaproteobacteria bacterium]|nr:hypothetical protein [Alphaproteobacteria bacterium]
MEDLGRRIAKFFGISETEVLSALYDKDLRKGLAADLKGTAEWCEVDAEAYEASMLWREVMAI